ncbi:MAG: GGDEF domain-containing protein [Arcobacteraceae bacterium]
MNTNKKVLTIIIVMMLAVSLCSIAIFIYNFKTYSIKHTTEKAISIAQNVRDGLTAHMVSGTMDKRDLFLSNIANNQNIKNFHLYRAPSVVSEYVQGFYNETQASEIEKKALETTSIQTKLIESVDEVILKVSIPYIASRLSTPNCITCHTKAKTGDVLGVISMDLDVSSTRLEGIEIASKILLIVIILLVVSIVVVNYFIKPYVKLFDDLENGISQAYRGDFTYKIDTTLTNEAGEVANRVNELAEIYKFKNTIDLDVDQYAIYERIIYILKSKFSIKHFMLFEVDVKTKKRKIVHNSLDEQVDTISDDVNLCRAFRTASNVSSTDFDEICLNCEQKKPGYKCLFYNINEDNALIIHISLENEQQVRSLESYIPVINNYMQMAKPVIESKILMGMLKKTVLIDPMTTLYNRRFLNELVDSNIPSRITDNHIHSILMVDIDFFKQVNDTYGHATGDEVIKTLGTIMKESIRDSDMAVRYGGEEFLILLLNTTRKSSIATANSIKNKFSLCEFSSPSETFKKTLSIGIAYYPENGETLWKVIKYADEALYVAKNTGRNKIVNFDKTMHNGGDNY